VDEFLAQKELADDEEVEDEVGEDEVEDDDIRCPKCRSEEVVLDSREPAARGVEPATAMDHSKYKWNCDACGDDGIEG
jgi:hypothetical protein